MVMKYVHGARLATNPSPSPSPLAATRFSFFMHDIFGGSAPSVRVVAGNIVATNNQVTNGIPFSKPNGGIFPKSHGVPLITPNNGLNGNLQQLLFGTITVIDDELTQGHELGSSVIGKAQGFYLASSMDGTSHTMAFTAMFHDDHDDSKDDAISFFGVHRTAAVESHIAIVGGTGKYENAQGFALIETLHHTNQHTTDGIDTVLQFNVFLTN
ncbi:Plant disease resistance response protein [Corchorus capsularis]|uniref:Dirigent protein n=1 Tax=Corchorus capsularis TaxID=210143 RepID=A0A1R3HBD7_COCAP|nr:Plant disease resistance response protein [Corchorus capsularis]